MPLHTRRPRLFTFVTPVWTVSVFHVWLVSHFGTQQFVHPGELGLGLQPPTGVQLQSHHHDGFRTNICIIFGHGLGLRLNGRGGTRRCRLYPAFLDQCVCFFFQRAIQPSADVRQRLAA